MTNRPLWLMFFIVASGTIHCQQSENVSGLRIELIETSYFSTAQDNQIKTQITPKANIDVEIIWQNKQYQRTSDTQGIIEVEDINVTKDQPATIYVAKQGPYLATAVFDWPLSQLSLPLPISDTTPLNIAPELISTTLTKVKGIVSGWLEATAIGESQEVNMTWHHLNGMVLPATAPVSDLYATLDFDIGEENSDVVDFWVPTGTLELGFIEHIVDSQTRKLLETGGLFYQSAFVAATNNSDFLENFTMTTTSLTNLCPNAPSLGAMQINLNGLPRHYVIAAKGRLKVGIFLQSPFGLQLDLLPAETIMAAQDVISTEAGKQQTILLSYPFELTGTLQDFSYGYHIETTTTEERNQVAYTQSLYLNKRGGETNPCQIDVDVLLPTLNFTAPIQTKNIKIAQPLTLNWQATLSTPALKKIILYSQNAQQPTAIFWLIAPTRTTIALDAQQTSQMITQPGLQKLAVETYLETLDLTANTLVTPDIVFATKLNRVYQQMHTFTADE